MTAASTNTFIIKIDGTALPATADITSVVVEDHLHLPDSFAITLQDARRTALVDVGAKIGAKLSVAVLNDANAAPVMLLDGEITAVEAEIHRGTSYSVIRGYDQSHRLLHGSVFMSYLNSTYSDIAKKVAGRHGLGNGTITGTSPTHDHIAQAGESDWDFLRRLAFEVGFEVTVTNGKLNFAKPKLADSAPGSGDLTTESSAHLLVGDNILELRAAITSAEQTKEVEVRGWDPKTKKEVKATAPIQTKLISNSYAPGSLAEPFPGPKLMSVDVPMSTTTEAENSAKALAEQVASVSTEMEGVVRGDPKLRAGTPVRVGLLGKPFDGKYVLTTTRHTYDHHEGYVTAFTISGRIERSMFGLAGGGSGVRTSRMAGLVPGIVDDVKDPEKMGRVRLKFPWMDDVYRTDWARVAQPGAGKDRGFLILPEVADEVLVGFEHGDLRRPYVISGLHNGKDKAKSGPGELLDGTAGQVNNRLFTSRKGHQLVFVDAATDCGVTISTGDGKVLLKLDQSSGKLEISAASGIVLKTDSDLTVDAKGSIKMKATGSFEVKAMSVKLEGDTTAGVKAAQVSIEGSGPVKVTGTPIQLN